MNDESKLGTSKAGRITLHTETGHVYMTEDHKNGSFYRFVPDDQTRPMDSGTLQAMVLEGLIDTDPEQPLDEGRNWEVKWVDVPDPQANERPCREQTRELGAARFNRCEGSVWDGEYLVHCLTAGPVNGGQIFRYQIQSETLTLWKQVTDRSICPCPTTSPCPLGET